MVLPDGQDFLFRPVLEGLIRGESLWDGTVGLAEIAALNEALDARAENQARAQAAAERRGRHG